MPAGRRSARELNIEAECLARRLGPGEHSLEHGTRRDDAPLAEVDHLPVHAVANRSPEVLLDLALTQRLGRAALLQIDSGLRHTGCDQGGEVERLVATGLRVADPDLDRAEGVVRAHAPP